MLASYIASNGGDLVTGSTSDDRVLALGTVHSYSVSFDMAAAIVFGTALVSAAMFGRQRRRATNDPVTEESEPLPEGAST